MGSSYSKRTPKCVFVTGATGGFGEAFAKRFAETGAKLILHGRSAEKLQTLCDSIDADIHPIIFDLKDKEGTIKAIDSIPAEFEDIDLLVNNAGGALGLDKAHEANLDDWDDMIEMNAASLARITRLVLPQMVERKNGHVINIGSIAGNWAYPGGNVYGAVKAFVRHFSLNLRADLIGTNVRVTNVEPGIAKTPFSIARFKGDKEKADAVYAGTIALTADDIAETVFWSATLPEHVNVNTVEVMPTQQSFSPLHVERN